jgi:uncharacterized protein (UPF0332 family)
MSIEEQEIVRQEAHAEAMRYVQNAKEVLQKAGKEGSYYHDCKYVRMACGTAYSGMLVALEAWLRLKNVPEAKRKSIDYYRKNIGKIDRKLLSNLNDAYDTLHLLGYYDGTLDVVVVQAGFNLALAIIERIKPAQPIDPEVWAESRKKNRS